MAILIDGYNLLHVTGIFGRGRGPGTLERSRRALLNFLAESIEPTEVSRTTVVFDAGEPPFGLPRTTTHGGMTVRFSSEYGSADELIEELIAANSAPKRLVVVSSDHRLHRAARKRRATPIDSDIWYGQLVEQRQIQRLTSPPVMLRPEEPLTEGQIEYWLQHFDRQSENQTEAAAKRKARMPRQTTRRSTTSKRQADTSTPEVPRADASDSDRPDIEPFNPFPPGYA